ncbi:hypothetical protein HELRODRAFT_76186 [Helobdella robusta]|uniref:chitin synthase n=1 Tax=Helobdella robusta TaxID=6412 RepID=T1G2G4_HELRO|nr:hypothetical protein HELRODRAFT_76186 [Helobdella robusta]ESO07781.1 hypothetical protein HELRODRAFT_76186 [Helobdella robusta]
MDWVWVWLVHTLASLVSYFFARTSAKILVQRVCYALPIAISPYLLSGLVIGGCELHNRNPCVFSNETAIPDYLFYECYDHGSIGNVWFKEMWYLIPIFWASQLWIGWHIWFPKCKKLTTADKLFVQPLYDGVLMDQSLLYNRRRRDETRNKVVMIVPLPRDPTTAHHVEAAAAVDDGQDTDLDQLQLLNMMKDKIPFVYLCATMWHEGRSEMFCMLKSIFKLDIDQCARKNAQTFFKFKDPDYYDFEGHIFFDDAFIFFKNNSAVYEINSYVRDFIDTIQDAATAAHGITPNLQEPIIYQTPYGGRLEYILPGENKLIVHLKDSAKIRHRKRWSQVMYMYYFLGNNLEMKNYEPWRKEIRKENTFLLALDGDIDFEPTALLLLIDLMKRDEMVGAACGRIHPTGTGPMVWYQQFEYALGHWMQKAAEHVFGCVLCSPGCFSLFRGSALMSANVMAMYTTMSTEPLHYIQYDQGEDRWLCTLLLQQGYRVEYCAASDSYTHAPEGLHEFFKQRRRWMVSTMANILDLLVSWKLTTKKNENISSLYIFYQMMLFGVSIVGPGTIFLLISGAVNVALNNQLTIFWSSVINIVPICLFILLCYIGSSEVQLYFATLLAGFYCAIQMLVLVGLSVQMASNPIIFPTTIFFIFVTSIFILAAVLHPQEFFCLFHGFTYYLAIPTMYLLLNLYAIINMNVVTWGTRDDQPTQIEKELKDIHIQQEQQQQQQQQQKSLLSALRLDGIKKEGDDDEEDGFHLNCGCFKVACCVTKGKNDCNKRHQQENTEKILAEIKNVENRLSDVIESKFKSITAPSESSLNSLDKPLSTNATETDSHIKSDATFPNNSSRKDAGTDYTTNTNNTDNNKDDTNCNNNVDLKKFQLKSINASEAQFFSDLTKVYLYPLIKNKETEEKLAKDLLDLRNKASIAYLLINAIFVIVVISLQMNLDKIYIPWFWGDNINVDPLGFTFMLVYGLVMIIQVIGMIIHRTSTFLHVMATTSINSFLCCKKRKSNFVLFNQYVVILCAILSDLSS